MTTSALLTYAEAGEYLHVSAVTVQRRVLRGELASVRIGRARRIRPCDIDAFIERQREEARQ